VVTFEQKDKQEELDAVESITDRILPLEDKYDDTPEPGANGLYGLELNDGLTEAEMKVASFYALLSRGVMIVHGNPGCGKGVFGTFIAWKLRRFFKSKRVLLDYSPRRLFDYGYYNNQYEMFNADVMMKEIKKMGDTAGKVINSGEDADLKDTELADVKDLTKKWANDNKLKFVECILEWDELKRYFHNRRPHNPLGVMGSNIISVWRHLGMLVLGMCPNIREIDSNGFLQYVTHEVRPDWCSKPKIDTTLCRIRRKSHVSFDGIIKFETKPRGLFVNGGKPRPEIGVQLINPELANGNQEKRIVEFLQDSKLNKRNNILGFCEGLSNLNEIAEAIDEDIDECKFRLLAMNGIYKEDDPNRFVSKGAIQCKKVFDLYNSKDIKNLNPRLKMEE